MKSDSTARFVDLSHVIDPDISRRLMKRYLGGDRSLFVRRLLGMSFGEAGPAIRRKFEDHPEFRRNVLEYIEQFERLIGEARLTDPENVVSTTFLTADVGKLYLLLREILGKK